MKKCKAFKKKNFFVFFISKDILTGHRILGWSILQQLKGFALFLL